MIDSHFHVIAPEAAAPMFAGRSYTPAPAALADWQATLGPLGVTQGAVVQPSFYGTDARVLLATLAAGQGRLVGIAAVDATVSDAELDRLVAAGVRGVRMAHADPNDPRTMAGLVPFSAFDALEARLAARGLHLQLLTDSRWLAPIAERLRRARVPVVIDHMGRAPAALGTAHDGVRVLTQLLNDAPVWVKLSGAANLSTAAPDYDDAAAMHRCLLAAAPQRCLWGSDWPHTRPRGTPPDTAHLLALARAWTPPALHDAVFRGNAAQLYRLG